jgi:hypothetical protein
MSPGEQSEAFVKPSVDLVERQRAQPSGSELDRERDPI